MMHRKVAIMVAVGGAAGAVTRWALSEAVESSNGWPTDTFLANLLGCVALGYLVTRYRPVLHTNVVVGATTGFCGALTTFSTFALELAQFLDDGRAAMAVSYLVTSLVGGIAVFWVGVRAGSTAVTGSRR